MQVKEKGIILAKTKYGESDLILKIITSKGEVFSAMAKSALKSKKRFGGGVLEPTHYVLFSLTRRQSEDVERLAIVDDALMIDDFKTLKTDYDRLDLALHFVKTVATVAREGGSHLELFNLLGHALKAAEVSTQLQILKLQFHLKVLHSQGVLPPSAHYAPYLKSSIRVTEEADKLPMDDLSMITEEVEYLFGDYMT